MTTFIEDTASGTEPPCDPVIDTDDLGERSSEPPADSPFDTATTVDEIAEQDAEPGSHEGEPRSARDVLAELEVSYPTYFADPDLLIRGPNRPEKPDDADFDADLAAHGNYVPIIATVDDKGLVVEDGWHRTRALQRAAAIARDQDPDAEVRKAWIIVLPPDAELSEKQRVIDRVRMQFATGKYRFTQNDADRLAAAAALFAVKATVKDVRQTLGLTAKEATAYRKVATSETATAAVNAHQFDIFHAAAADRFADDPHRTALLAQAELDGLFDHVYAQMIAEDEAAEADRLAAEEAEATRVRVAAAYEATANSYTERGFAVYAELPDDTDNWLPLDYLLTATADRPGEAELTAHPQAFAVVLTQRIVHVETGEAVDPDSIDPYTRDYPDIEFAVVGKVHIRDVQESEEFDPTYYCIDLDTAGLFIDPAELPDDTESDNGSDADRSTGRTESIAQRMERKERQEAERKRHHDRTRVLNTKSVAAAKVRRDWVSNHWFTNKKVIVAGMGALIGLTMEHAELIDRYHARYLADDLGNHIVPADAGVTARDNAGLLYTALRVVAALEIDILSNPDVSDAKARGWRQPRNPLWKPYIDLLASHGYPVSPFERILTGELTADQVYDGVTEPVADADDTDETEDESEIESVQESDEPDVESGEGGEGELGSEDPATVTDIPEQAAA
ncbi:hypothetical protein [Nocardia aurea]|uniref:hypothetical protein n=1 Tax=Nocardia aurea TaxID=2144174 RepID=UPI000D69F0A3|nr:hypothetical protein [Nocardia aurea]